MSSIQELRARAATLIEAADEGRLEAAIAVLIGTTATGQQARNPTGSKDPLD